MTIMEVGVNALERGLVPDAVTRLAIRRLCTKRLREIEFADEATNCAQFEFLDSLRCGPIALVPEKANQQHYELPPEFFAAFLGPRRKYSSCYWPDGVHTLAVAEDAALAVTCERAELCDGQAILELGCGWGSLSLWMAERFSNSRITVVSNSAAQKRFIDGEARIRGLANLRVVTADMNDFDPALHCVPGCRFDRVVSVEMFEHMRNYNRLLGRIAAWMRPEGKLFVHIFCHRLHAYPFETQGATNWMGRHFFTGGIMPSANLLHCFDRDLAVTQQWSWNGTHYQRTAEAWLANFDGNVNALIPILKRVYGADAFRRWLQRWRVFFLAVAELFRYNAGDEWFVSHYLMAPVH